MKNYCTRLSNYNENSYYNEKDHIDAKSQISPPKIEVGTICLGLKDECYTVG